MSLKDFTIELVLISVGLLLGNSSRLYRAVWLRQLERVSVLASDWLDCNLLLDRLQGGGVCLAVELFGLTEYFLDVGGSCRLSVCWVRH